MVMVLEKRFSHFLSLRIQLTENLGDLNQLRYIYTLLPTRASAAFPIYKTGKSNVQSMGSFQNVKYNKSVDISRKVQYVPSLPTYIEIDRTTGARTLLLLF